MAIPKMLATRVIARLDIKPNLGVVKGVRMEGLRVIGDPRTLAAHYASAGADELLYLDVTASLYCCQAILPLVRWTSEGDIWIPLTVGGGMRSLDDMKALLRAGADKVAINTAALDRPALIRECAESFGSQCVVLSVEAKKCGHYWRAYTRNGRENSLREVVAWCEEAVSLGAGEVLLTSVDRDGTGLGFDLDLIRAVGALSVPLIAAGGMGKPVDALHALNNGADAVAVGTWLHQGGRMEYLKMELAASGVEIRG